MTERELEDEKKELIEQLGVHLEGENLAPVAARILATLILTGQEGITFDQLVCDLNASKSTISTHLDHLQSTSKVRYYTKTGDRKRYFIINPELMMNQIDEMLAKWESQKMIHDKVLGYKKRRNKFNKERDGFQFDLDFQKGYLSFLDEATAAIQKLKNKIKQKHLTNHNS